MTITTTIIRRTVVGNMRTILGKSVFSGTTNTGDVVTGLNSIEFFSMMTKGTTAKAVSMNEDFPLASGDITVYSESNDATFYWEAIGR